MTAASPAFARAAPEVEFDIPAGRLAQAAIALGKQARVAIIIFDKQAGEVRVPALRGRLSAEEALRRLLAGTGFTFRKTGAGDFSIIRASPHAKRTGGGAASARPGSKAKEAPPTPIIVTASKMDALLRDYPGSVAVLDMEGGLVSARPARGTGLIIDQLPVLASTSLGAGRNKLFARGIADSSFNGQSEANIGQYFGDLRLTYSGPDPDLNLFDISKVEVLTGPYGTLYGTGALGGVIRIEPNRPDPRDAGGRIALDVASVRHGGTGISGAGMINVPLIRDRAAIRLVGYRTTNPGYLDDPERGRSDINRQVTTGGRLAATFRPDDVSSIDAGFVFQDIRARGSDYSNAAGGGLTVRSPVDEPFSSDYLLSSLAYRTERGGLRVSSTLGFVRQRNEDAFELLGDGIARTRRRSTMLSNETRISGEAGAVRFVGGVSFAANQQRETLGITFSGDPYLTFVQDQDSFDLSLFGEARIALSEALSATVGARVNHVWIDTVRGAIELDERGKGRRADAGFFPTLALSWRPVSDLQLYASYRTGGRSGATIRYFGTTSSSGADRLSSIATGFLYAPSSALQMAATLSRTTWKNIQADMFLGVVANSTIRYNLGDATIWGLEASAMAEPAPGLRIDANIFMNNSPLLRPFDTGGIGFFAKDLRLPNIADWNARAALRYRLSLPGDAGLILSAALRYYGPISAELERSQPGYAETGIDARLVRGRWAATIAISNLFDSRSSRFGLVNMYSLLPSQEQQYTPLQPRTVTVGLEADF